MIAKMKARGFSCSFCGRSKDEVANIITGTPQGVGFARKPPEFMKVGDSVEVEIEGIGVLENRVASRP